MFEQIYLTYLLAPQRVQPSHRATIQLDSIRNISEHLLEGVSSFLIEQYANCLTGFDTAPDDSDQLWFDEVLRFPLQLGP